MRSIDVHKLADEARLNRFHGLVLLWCSLIIIFDGYDLAVAGIALPLIMKEMGISAMNAGFMVSSALFGMMLGAILFGTLADKVGRRMTIVICVALFSVFTAAAGLTSDPITFSITRFLAGLGIGGVMPNVVAHMTEYSPKRVRSTMVTLMFSGYAVGGMLAAVLGKSFLETYGWQAVFFAAAAPLVTIPFILKSLPESLAYLLKAQRLDDLKSVAQRIDPSYAPTAKDQFTRTQAGESAGASVRQLFTEGRGLSTLMFWVTFFMCLFMAYALSSWLVKLMASAGYNLSSALTFVLVLNFGAIVGAVSGGWLADRFHIKHVLVFLLAIAAVSITFLGYNVPTSLQYLLVGLAGGTTIGTQILVYAYVGQYYPAAFRSTGIGWASGVGRVGAILAPILIGFLVAKELPIQQNFAVIAAPALVALVAIALINHKRSAAVQGTYRLEPGNAVNDPQVGQGVA